MDKETQLDPESNWMGDELTPQFMFELYTGGVIGTKEFRSWLASVSLNFAAVRDADVDNEIDRLARQRAQEIREAEDEVRSLGKD